MGKTQSGAVWLDENKTSPFDFYQYWRNVDDADVLKCIRMLTFLPLEEIEKMESWQGSELNKAKEILAYELTALVHGEEKATKAQEAARALFSGAADTDNMPTVTLSADDFEGGQVQIIKIMLKAGLIKSNGEGRRLIQQGGVSVDDHKVTDPLAVVSAADFQKGHIILKKGKKVFYKVTVE